MIFLITNASLCSRNETIRRIREAAFAGVDYIVLRENDLNDDAYYNYALSVLQVIANTRTELIISHRDEIADKLSLKKHNRYREKTDSSFIVSTHCVKEASRVHGYHFFSHIFKTDCKKNKKPIGLNELKRIKSDKVVPLGGIKAENLYLLKGYKNIGVMSEWLHTDNIPVLIEGYKKYGY